MALPSALYIAAAMAINKTRPERLSVQGPTKHFERIVADSLTCTEYLHSLRQHIVVRQDDGQTSRVIDHSAFWQSQYSSLESHLEEALDEAFLLRQRNESLESQIADLQVKASSWPRKRKSGESVDGRMTKKRKHDNSTPQAEEVLGFHEEFPSTRAMRHVHRVQWLCKGNMYGTDARDLSYHLIRAIEALTVVVENLPRESKTAQENIRSTTVALARSCISVYHGLKRLSTLPSSSNYPSHVVYSCVCFFDGLFTSIEEAASHQNKAQASPDPKQTSDSLSLLTALATSLVSYLQESSTTCVQHADILEGLTYHLLYRLGEVTHELLLDGPGHPDIEHEIVNLSLSEDNRLDPTRLKSLTSMALQAPYMLTVLKRAITSATCIPTSLVRSVRSKLQRTLVECIFGPGTGASASRDILMIPEAIGSPPIPQVEDKVDDLEKAKDDFEAELWALIGWDILGRDEDL